MSSDSGKLCHISIDASNLCNVDECNFYRLAALEIIGQLVKQYSSRGLLNMPLPQNHHAFYLFLQAIDDELPNGHEPIIIVLRNPQVLSPTRRERFSSLFSASKRGLIQRIGLVLA